MHEYWERRLREARKINEQIEAELEIALASVAPEAAAPVRAAIGAGTADSGARRRYARVVPRATVRSERRRSERRTSDRRHGGDVGSAPARLLAHAPCNAPIPPLVARRPGVEVVMDAERAVAVPAAGEVHPLWSRGLLAALYALGSNLALFGGLVVAGAVDRVPDRGSLPAVLAVTAVLCAITATFAYGQMRLWLARPAAAFRLASAAAAVVLLVCFLLSPGATFLSAIVAILATGIALDGMSPGR
jgi:hypothetical protein